MFLLSAPAGSSATLVYAVDTVTRPCYNGSAGFNESPSSPSSTRKLSYGRQPGRFAGSPSHTSGLTAYKWPIRTMGCGVVRTESQQHNHIAGQGTARRPFRGATRTVPFLRPRNLEESMPVRVRTTKNLEVVSTRLPAEEAARLRAMARADDRSCSQYARRLLLDGLKRATDEPKAGAGGA